MVQLVGKEIGSTGYGMMGLTWRADPCPQSQAFAAMRASLAHGANFWNGGELYGKPERNSLHLLNEYFTKYPGDAAKVVLSIKGGLVPGERMPDGSAKNIRRSIDECLRVLDGKKTLDLFECARVDPNVPLEETLKTIDEYVKAGKVGGVSLSEVSAATIRKAAQVVKVAAVEVEFSLWATDILENGIADACAELNIPVVAYSPLGRGFLTGQIKSIDDMDAKDLRRTLPRFQGEAFQSNLKLVEELNKLAAKKMCTSAQLALGWVKAQSGKKGRPIIIPIPGATTEARVAENMTDATLTDTDLQEIQAILDTVPVVGGRYPDGVPING